MAASYPGSKKTFSQVVNGVTKLVASLFNAAYDEIEAIETDLLTGGVVPSGGIIMWSGAIADIPDGWYLCNGSNGTPDLRDRFIVGAKEDDGGVAKTNVTGSLTQSGDGQIPAHTHTYNESLCNSVRMNGSDPAATTTTYGQATGSYGTGTKVVAVYYALAFIMKS